MGKLKFTILLIVLLTINSCYKFHYSVTLKLDAYNWTHSTIYLNTGDTLNVTPTDLNTNYSVEIGHKKGEHHFKFFENDKLLFQDKVSRRYTGSIDFYSGFNNVVFIKGQKFTIKYFHYNNTLIIDKFPFTQPAPDSPTVYYQDYLPVNSNISTSDIRYVQNYFEVI